MALSLDSKIRDIMRSEEGKAVMEKWAPGSSKAVSYTHLLYKNRHVL